MESTHHKCASGWLNGQIAARAVAAVFRAHQSENAYLYDLDSFEEYGQRLEVRIFLSFVGLGFESFLLP